MLKLSVIFGNLFGQCSQIRPKLIGFPFHIEIGQIGVHFERPNAGVEDCTLLGHESRQFLAGLAGALNYATWVDVTAISTSGAIIPVTVLGMAFWKL